MVIPSLASPPRTTSENNKTKKQKLPEAVAHEAGGKIFTLGSYRLGVHQQGADIDTLVLSPKHVDREDFFTELYQMLLARPEVTSLIVMSR